MQSCDCVTIIMCLVLLDYKLPEDKILPFIIQGKVPGTWRTAHAQYVFARKVIVVLSRRSHWFSYITIIGIAFPQYNQIFSLCPFFNLLYL